MAIACKYCTMLKGLKGSEIGSLPQTDEEFYKHIEQVHHIPVKGEDETEESVMVRFQQENPEAGGPNCRCPSCMSDKRGSYV